MTTTSNIGDLFIQASRDKLRFDSPKGKLTAEDLWDLDLQSTTGKANLDSIAIELNQKVKSTGETVSFVSQVSADDDGSKVKLEIVKHIIGVKIAERDAKAAAKKRREKKQEIMALIAQKEAEQLGGQSLEELRKLAAQLDE